MKSYRIFDNGGESADRYTLFPYSNSEYISKRVMFLGFSEGGNGFSQWGEIDKRDIHNLSFLGKELDLSDLSQESQNHVNLRVGTYEE